MITTDFSLKAIIYFASFAIFSLIFNILSWSVVGKDIVKRMVSQIGK